MRHYQMSDAMDVSNREKKTDHVQTGTLSAEMLSCFREFL